MSPRPIKAAVICMTSTSDKARNVETALAFVDKAAKDGADWVQLPEMFAFHGPYDKVYDMAEGEDGPINRELAALAKTHGVVVFGGTAGERPGEQDLLEKHVAHNAQGHRRVYNTHYVFGRDGKRLAKYRKTHLFNLMNEDGTPKYCESDGYIPGDQAVSVEVDGFRVGLSICYDLRFPQLYDKLAAGGAPDVLAIPSAFTHGTGKAHWELLLRARAVERQAYVYAANQVGQHGPGKESFGHSMIVDPWGAVLANTGAAPGIATAEISHAMIKEVRAKLPALANQRPTLYGR